MKEFRKTNDLATMGALAAVLTMGSFINPLHLPLAVVCVAVCAIIKKRSNESVGRV